jgi:hypothetical protein
MAPARDFRGFFVGPPKFGRSKSCGFNGLFELTGGGRVSVGGDWFFWGFNMANVRVMAKVTGMGKLGIQPNDEQICPLGAS